MKKKFKISTNTFKIAQLVENYKWKVEDLRTQELIKKLDTVECKLMKISIMDVFYKDTIIDSTLIISGPNRGSTQKIDY